VRLNHGVSLTTQTGVLVAMPLVPTLTKTNLPPGGRGGGRRSRQALPGAALSPMDRMQGGARRHHLPDRTTYQRNTEWPRLGAQPRSLKVARPAASPRRKKTATCCAMPGCKAGTAGTGRALPAGESPRTKARTPEGCARRFLSAFEGGTGEAPMCGRREVAAGRESRARELDAARIRGLRPRLRPGSARHGDSKR